MNEASQGLNINQYITYWKNLSTWIFTDLLSADYLIQYAIIGISVVAGYYVSRLVRSYFSSPTEEEQKRTYFRSLFIRVLRRLAFSVTALAILGVAIMVYNSLEEPYIAIHKLGGLLIAWAVIRLGSTLIQNPAIGHTVSVTAWAIAALHLWGYLPLTIDWLRGFKISDSTDSLTLYDIISSTLSVASFIWLALLIANLLERWIENNPHLSLSARALFSKVSKFALIGAAFLMGLNAVGINLTAFAVFGGAIAVGIGLGLQKVFSNLMAGIILLLDKSIKPGDTLKVNERYGRVNKLSARYVSMITRDGTEHLIPNDELINHQVENWSYSDPNVRLRIPVGIHYNSDVKQAMALCEEAAKEVPRVLHHPAPVCLMRGFGDNAINLEQRIWVRDPMNGCGNVKSQVLVKIWEKFREHGVDIPYPQRDLHIRSVDKGAVTITTQDMD